MQTETNSILTLENRKKLTLTGVTSLDSFSDREIVLKVGSAKLRIGGERLKVLAFSEGTGNFAASGDIRSLRYGEKNLASIFR